ncbi:MAG TPA: FAD-dependent oxidoreductase [Thermoanaerobaculia bacterium]|nr:FAD-dependent oxidoreductase [Thermoanaerobaculia bacterium]
MNTRGAIVTEIEELAPKVLQLTIAFDEDGFEFKPGQWVNFRFPEGVSRAYTIASAPERPQAVQLCVRVGPGKGGEAVSRLKAGSEISVDGPYGSFLLPDDATRDVIFLAGDTGIAPIRSIVLHMLAKKDPRRIFVLYEPDRRHILYAGDFDPLARSGAIVHESGRIETLIDRNKRIITDGVIMVCGFDPFLQRVNAALSDLDIDPAQVISETFGPQPV